MYRPSNSHMYRFLIAPLQSYIARLPDSHHQGKGPPPLLYCWVTCQLYLATVLVGLLLAEQARALYPAGAEYKGAKHGRHTPAGFLCTSFAVALTVSDTWLIVDTVP